MKIAIIYNSEKDNCLKIAETCKKVFESEGAKVSVFDLLLFSAKDIEDVDIIITVGGDGTILRVAKVAALVDKPIIGVNAGRLGYLASITPDETEKLKSLVSGDFIIENRSMIKADVLKKGKIVDSTVCLNDIVISHGVVSTLIDIELKIDNDVIDYRADGIVIATPSGSTAYSMSAGGPVVDPSLDCFIVTPVCPHTLQSRPLIVNNNKKIDISVDSTRETKIFLSSDGQTVFELSKDCLVSISNAKQSAKFIKLNDVSVYKVFSEKTKIL